MGFFVKFARIWQMTGMTINVLYIFLLCIGASFIQRTTGFGFGIFIMTVLPFLTDSYGEATALSGMLAMTTSLFITFRMRKYITWKRLWPMLLTFAVVSAVAVFSLRSINDVVLRRILGAVLILTSFYFLLSEKIHIRPGVPAQIGAGAVSGLLGGFFGMQGPPAVLYFMSSEPDKEHYMAMIQTYLLLGNAMMTITRAGSGYLTRTVGIDYLTGLGGIAIGTVVGALVFRHIPAKLFSKVVYGYIGVCGVIILLTV